MGDGEEGGGEEKFEINCKDNVNKLIHAYNCTVDESTGYSPFSLLFGRSPRLLIDIMFDLKSESGPSSYAEYVSKCKTPIQEAYSCASWVSR